MFFFCSVQFSNLISRNFYYDTTQQYRYVFCLNCNFVIDAAAEQLVSGSSLKYEVSYRVPCVKLRDVKFCIIFLVKLRAISYIVAIYVYCCNMC